MAWDPALLRKYNTTNHFRLLSQVRTELREQPIQRPLVTSRAAAASGQRRGGRRSEGAAPATTALATATTTPVAVGSGHAITRRRTQVPVVSAPVPQDHQPIVAVPVLTDIVLPDAHA